MNESGISLKGPALIAGVSLVIMTIAAIVGTEMTLLPLIDHTDPISTLFNVKQSLDAFLIGSFAWLVILITDVLVAWALYVFLKPVNPNISLIAGWFRLIYAAVLAMAILNLVDVLTLLRGEDVLSAGEETFAQQIQFSLLSFEKAWSYGLILFGVHLYFLGGLIVKSGYIPKILGWLIFLAGIGYIVVHLARMLIPQYEELIGVVEMIFMIPMLSEVALGIWLIVRGRKVTI